MVLTRSQTTKKKDMGMTSTESYLAVLRTAPQNDDVPARHNLPIVPTLIGALMVINIASVLLVIPPFFFFFWSVFPFFLSVFLVFPIFRLHGAPSILCSLFGSQPRLSSRFERLELGLLKLVYCNRA